MSHLDLLTSFFQKTHCERADKSQFRLLSAWEMLEVKAEALALASEEEDLALCRNACLLAKVWLQDTRPCFASGKALLQSLSPQKIQALAQEWHAFQSEHPLSLSLPQEEVDDLKDALRNKPAERLRWQVLRSFGVLPSEERAKQLLERDLLWCSLHLLLDEEERLAMLCPKCRADAEAGLCPVCGTSRPIENPQFDMKRFLQLKELNKHDD